MTFSSFFSSPETQAALPAKEDVKAFQLAALGGRDSDVEDFLKECPKLVNAQDERGWTGLMLAATQGHFSTVRLLMENGADSALKNNDDQTAEQLSFQHGHVKLIPFIHQLKTEILTESDASQAKGKLKAPKP